MNILSYLYIGKLYIYTFFLRNSFKSYSLIGMFSKYIFDNIYRGIFLVAHCKSYKVSAWYYTYIYIIIILCTFRKFQTIFGWCRNRPHHRADRYACNENVCETGMGAIRKFSIKHRFQTIMQCRRQKRFSYNNIVIRYTIKVRRRTSSFLS